MGEWLNAPETRWIAGFAIALVVAVLACRVRSLTVSGAVAAAAVGGLIVGAAGWWAGIVLVTFFVTSSALSTLAARRSTIVEQARGTRRDAVQVMANGGIPALCAVSGTVAATGGPWRVAMAAALAGAAADTWATEIGRFSRARPRLVTTGKAVTPGTSGAISLPGTLGSVAGSVTVALVAAAGRNFGFDVAGTSFAALVSIVAAAGMAGSLTDSLLGATVQAVFHCPACDRETERPLHRCGTPTRQTRGVAWMNNDTVNLLAILTAAGIGLAAAAIWPVVA